MSREAAARRAVWDWPTRAFHWLLAILVMISFATGKIGGGWMEWHMRSGYAILALLLFRLAWGVAGSTSARFSAFVRGPRAALDYARGLLRGDRSPWAGHNPLGGRMVIAMLAILLLQAITGLFADDEIAAEGPLAATVANATVARMSIIHEVNQWVIVGAVAVHVVAVSAYQWGLGMDLIRPMIFGSPPRRASNLLAAALLLAAAAAVYGLVVLYPRGWAT